MNLDQYVIEWKCWRKLCTFHLIFGYKNLKFVYLPQYHYWWLKIVSFGFNKSTFICTGPTGLMVFPELSGDGTVYEIRYNKRQRCIKFNISRSWTESDDLHTHRGQIPVSTEESESEVLLRWCLLSGTVGCQTQRFSLYLWQVIILLNIVHCRMCICCVSILSYTSSIV